jgi:hypothetical protein
MKPPFNMMKMVLWLNCERFRIKTNWKRQKFLGCGVLCLIGSPPARPYGVQMALLPSAKGVSTSPAPRGTNGERVSTSPALRGANGAFALGKKNVSTSPALRGTNNAFAFGKRSPHQPGPTGYKWRRGLHQPGPTGCKWRFCPWQKGSPPARP